MLFRSGTASRCAATVGSCCSTDRIGPARGRRCCSRRWRWRRRRGTPGRTRRRRAAAQPRRRPQRRRLRLHHKPPEPLLQSARLRPAVIPFENRFEQRRKPAQQGLVRPQAPVKGNLRFRAGLFQTPDAAPYEIALGANFEAVGFFRTFPDGRPAQRVRQPALGVQSDAVAHAVSPARRRLVRARPRGAGCGGAGSSTGGCGSAGAGRAAASPPSPASEATEVLIMSRRDFEAVRFFKGSSFLCERRPESACAARDWG